MNELDYLEQIADSNEDINSYIQSIDGTLNRLNYDFTEFTAENLSLNENIVYAIDSGDKLILQKLEDTNTNLIMFNITLMFALLLYFIVRCLK